MASAGLVLAMILTGFLLPLRRAEAAANNTDTALEQFYQRAAPHYDLNLSRNLQNLRQIGSQQLAALEQFKAANNAPNMQIRWNTFGGSPDAIYDFASQSFPGTPEEAGRAFLAQNAAIFGISDVNNLRVFSQRDALGGNLIRFQQTFNDIPVKDGGIGLVMNANNQVIMASGPFFRDVNVNTQPNLTPEQAKAAGE